MDISTQRKIAAILQILVEADQPLGSTKIARELHDRGIDLKGRMVRYYLEEMDRLGFTENLGRAGRAITELGRKELASAVAVDRVGFVSDRVDELAYKLTFNTSGPTGTVILNVSTVPLASLNRAKSIIRKSMDAGLGMGRFLAIARPGQSFAGYSVPKRKVAFGTVCSVTVNGVLYNEGIPVRSKFGGLLEIRDGKPLRFTQIIHYDGTTIDPIEIFIKGKMTRVNEAATTGVGMIGASFREIPAAALPKARDVIDELERAGLNGVMAVGEPGRPLVEVPVPQGRVGLIVAAGLNPIGAVEECDIATENFAMASLGSFKELTPSSDL